MIEVQTGPRTVPILHPKHKWDVVVNRPPEPFCIGFNICGVAREDGLSCKTLISYGKTYMGAVLENGDRLVGFPERVKKIQLRIVVGYILCSRATSGRFD